MISEKNPAQRVHETSVQGRERGSIECQIGVRMCLMNRQEVAQPHGNGEAHWGGNVALCLIVP
jgi:hypothetical protein